MSCLTCGEPLDENGSCPNCGATSYPPAPLDVDAAREHAHVTSPPGGAVLRGGADRLGVFQADGQRANWFVRIAVVIAAMLFAVITIGIVVVALAAVFTGVWLLPTGGGGAVIGIVILLLSLIILTAIGVMLWLLARGDPHSESRFRS
jgi:hypothetical protein